MGSVWGQVLCVGSSLVYCNSHCNFLQYTRLDPTDDPTELYGVPTIFICDIPIIQLEENGLIWLLKDILHAITHEEFGYLDYSSCFNETIKPECIIDHYHPEYITDTHNQCRRIKVKLSEEHRKKARNTKKYTRDYYI